MRTDQPLRVLLTSFSISWSTGTSNLVRVSLVPYLLTYALYSVASTRVQAIKTCKARIEVVSVKKGTGNVT